MLKATPSTSRSHERREGDKDFRRYYPSRPKPTTRVHDRRSSVQAQQCSSAADEGWRFVPDAILLGHRRAPQWVPATTPTVHRDLNSRKAVGGPFGSDSGYTANIFTFFCNIFYSFSLLVRFFYFLLSFLLFTFYSFFFFFFF